MCVSRAFQEFLDGSSNVSLGCFKVIPVSAQQSLQLPIQIHLDRNNLDLEHHRNALYILMHHSQNTIKIFLKYALK